MKQKYKHILRIGAFMLALIVPMLAFIPSSGYVDASILEIEKRPPLPPPTLADVSLSEYPTALEQFLQDRIPWRRNFILLNAGLNYRLFNTIESDKVMVGEDGWLFSKNTAPENNQFDYQGLDHFTDEETAWMQAAFAQLAGRFAENGQQLVLMVCPNKERIHSAQMPDSVPVINPVNRADALIEALSGIEGLTLVYPKETLQAAVEQERMYYKYDTHWNELGAYVGTSELLRALGQSPPPLSELGFAQTDRTTVHDLADSGGIYPFIDAEYVYDVPYAPGVEVTVGAGDTFTSTAPDGRKIMLLYDSYSINMRDYVNRSFASGAYSDLTMTNYESIQAAAPDIVVLQTVERNLYKLPGVLQTLLG